MILTKQSILTAIEQKAITITPFTEAHLKDASYTFTLDSRIKLLKNVPELNPHAAEYTEDVMPESGYVMAPGQFLVGYTKEKLTLHEKYACTLSVRSSTATAGLAALLTDTFCEPDTDNTIALAIHNASGLPLRLTPGMKVVKGFFFPVQ